VGDYRVIAGIADAKVTIFIVRVGHRREIYG
jgi:mRNA-degrading endonuclease RelE of RelBE toxin-antitoxin system